MKKFLHRFRSGQSTVELALLLPTLMFMLGMIIYGYRINHKLSDNVAVSYSEKMYKYHHEGLIYDAESGTYIPEGQFTEHIPADASINPAQLAAELGLQFAAQMGLSQLFSKLNIFDTSTYGGAFAQGFTYSLAESSVNHLIQDGNLNDMSATDLTNATWAGAASSLSSDAATSDFQGGDGKVTGTRELLGSGAQSGLIGFASSKGDWKAGATSAVGGMINSDTTTKWGNTGSDGTQILKGAGLGAIESSASGVVNGNFSVKTVLIGSATGAVHTDAFARTLPLTGSDPKNSAMYGAFNGAFSSVVSGGDTKSTLISAGTGAIGSKQTAGALGGSKSISYKAVNIAAGAGASMLQGQSLKAVGQGALTSAAGAAVGSAASWVGNQVAPSLSSKLSGLRTSSQVNSTVGDPKTASDTAVDDTFNSGTDDILDATSEGMMNAETLKSFKAKKKKENEQLYGGAV